VERAVGESAQALFDIRGRASILSRQVVYGSGNTRVYLRVATTEWFNTDTREEFERRASARAGEPVRLSLEQLPARGEDLEQLAALIPREEQRAVAAPPPVGDLGDLLASARFRLRQVARIVVPPEDVEVVGIELTLAETGRAILLVTYAAAEPLQSQAEEMLRRQLVLSPELPPLDVRFDFVSTAPLPVTGTAADSVVLRHVRERLDPRHRLDVELLFPEGADPHELEEIRRELTEHGVEPGRVRGREADVKAPHVRLAPAPISAPAEVERAGQ
jgi:hypothetical protein